MDFLSVDVHNEYVKRMEDEHARMNQRIADLETDHAQQGEIVRAVDKLAINMEQMLNEQKSQGERLDVIEGRDGEMWRKVVSYIVTGISGIVLGYIFQQIGM